MKLLFSLIVICFFSQDIKAAQSVWSLESHVESTEARASNPPAKPQWAYEIALNSKALVGLESLTFKIPGAIDLTAYVVQEGQHWDSRSWSGKFMEDPLGSIHLVSSGNVLSGHVSFGGQEYLIQDRGLTLQLIPVESRSLGPTDDSVAIQEVNPSAIVSTKSSDSFVDLMILYTGDVGGISGAESTLMARVDSVNQILADSCANFRYRLVHIQQVAYSETGVYSTDLNCITNPSDGCLDSIHGLRDTHGADLVDLVTVSGDLCGLAWLGQNNFFNDEYGFSVSGYYCGASTLAHELGHNLSIAHDRYEQNAGPQESTLLLEGYGFVDLANKYNSIMAYNSQCSDLGLSCTNVDKFSNPDINHGGVSFGIEGFSNAVQRMNDSYGFVANFRNSVTSFSPEIPQNCVAESKDINCFIATAAFGSYLHPYVAELRGFRDQVLAKSLLGRKFIKAYYKHSPMYAKAIQESPILKFFAQVLVFFLILLVRWPILGFGGFAFVVLLKKIKKMYVLFLVPFVLLPTHSARAQSSTSSTILRLNDTNPATRLGIDSKYLASVNYNLVEGELSNGSTYSVKDSGDFSEFLLGFYLPNFTLEVDYTGFEKKSSYLSTGLGTWEETEENNRLLLQSGFRAFGFNLGIKYGKDQLNNQTTLINESRDLLGLGVAGDLSPGIKYGLGGNIVSWKGSQRATVQWLEVFLGLGIGEFVAPEKYFAELTIFRSPEILQGEGEWTSAQGERLSIQLAGEYSFPTTLFFQRLVARLEYETFTEKKMDSFVLADIKRNTIGARFAGYFFDNLLLGLEYQTTSFSGPFERTEQVLSISLGIAGGGSSAGGYGAPPPSYSPGY